MAGLGSGQKDVMDFNRNLCKHITHYTVSKPGAGIVSDTNTLCLQYKVKVIM